ncbi:Phospholipase A(1) [Bertholletia excelsa]
MASSLAISFNSSKWNPQSLSSVFFPTIHPNKTLSFPLHPFKPNSLNIYCSPSLPTSSYLIPDLDKTQEKEEDESDERPLHQTWRQIQGCHDWQGLLDPTIHPNLRREIIRYGEFAQSCYDSFDFDPHSKYCGTCKYPPSIFFRKLNMDRRGYFLTRYLYATSHINLPNFFRKSKLTSVWSNHANWMGYVAVATDPDEIRRLGRRDIVVAWRGTVSYLEWIQDLKDFLRPAHFRPDALIKVESGFYDIYTQKERSCDYCTFSAREQVLAEIKRLIETYRGEQLSITITGHSLGAALALLNAYDIAEMKLNLLDNGPKIPITVFSFSGPRVGNLKFKERCDKLGVKVLRVINVHDKVPTVPGILANEKFWCQKYLEEAMSFPWSYAHVGVELALDHTHSPFLKDTKDIICSHNLEAHLHLLDGYNGRGSTFESVTQRDIALVNKSSNFLREEFGVPAYWWQEENKGMVFRERDGRWVVPERAVVEAPPPDTAHHFQEVMLQLAQSSLKAL